MTGGENDPQAVGCLGILFFILIILLAPGMMAVSVLRDAFSLTLDGLQMWTFSILVSIFIIGLLLLINHVRSRPYHLAIVTDVILKSIFQYLVVSCSLIILCYILFFGFRAQFPVKFLDWFRLYYRPFD